MEYGVSGPWIVDSSSGGDGIWVGGVDRQELIEFAPCDTASSGESKFTTTNLIQEAITLICVE